MVKVTEHAHGDFSWVDNSSSDPAAAIAFYMELFGWSKNEIPIGEGMTYTVFQLEGKDCAALSGMSPDQLQAGAPSQWNNFVTVEDVDALRDVVTAHGGAVIYGPEDVFEAGRMLHIQDPTGALLNLWQPYNSIGAGIVNAVGAMSLNELWTPDVALAKDFYHALFGWEYELDGVFTRIYNRGRFSGGMLQLDDVQPMWLPHFHVADVDAAISRVKALGGAIEIDKQVDADGAQWSVVADSAGALFYIMQLPKAEPGAE
ncbi:MAG: VOC family protein [Chloroflexi bacterium]|nr:VOC family protein [Chloroflexota bacterium]